MRFLLGLIVVASLPFWWIRRRMVTPTLQGEAVRNSNHLADRWDTLTNGTMRQRAMLRQPTPWVRLCYAECNPGGTIAFLTPNVILFSEFKGDPSCLEPISAVSHGSGVSAYPGSTVNG